MIQNPVWENPNWICAVYNSTISFLLSYHGDVFRELELALMPGLSFNLVESHVEVDLELF